MNQMTSGSLATSCGPSLFPYLPPSNANALLKSLIDHCSEIFQEAGWMATAMSLCIVAFVYFQVFLLINSDHTP